MKRTLKIKINPPQDVFNNLKEQLVICNSIFNRYIRWAYQNKTYNKRKAHQDLYKFLREKYPQINSALIQSTRDAALEAVKSVGFKTKPKKGRYSALRYDRRTFTLRGQQVTLTTMGKRYKEILHIPEYVKEIYETWVYKAAMLCYNKRQDQFYLNMVFENGEEIETYKGGIVGIDRGLYNLVTTSDGVNFSGNKLRATQRRYLFNRRKLQAKGTPSSRRLLRRISGREKRFSRDVNHCITKKLSRLPYSVFILEDLSSIRTQRRGKKLNKWLSSWPFYQFEQFLTYKAEVFGKKIEYVDAHYTSQKCSRCGNRSRHNRYKSRFKCSVCGFSEHADLNAAINIRNNYILSITPCGSIEQGLVNDPHESSGATVRSVKFSTDSSLTSYGRGN